METTTQTKICTTCKTEKPLNEFYYRKERCQYRKECKKCNLALRKVHRDNNKDKINGRSRKRYSMNKEEYLQRAKKYREVNKEKLSNSAKDYYQKNKKYVQQKRKEDRNKNIDEARRKDREYREKNKKRINEREKITRQSNKCKETKLLNNRKRRALKISTADGTITKQSLQELLNRQDNKCYHCGCELDDTKHLDHYIPLSKGGTHSIGNVVFAHPWCNMKKAAKIPKQLLLI